MQGKTTEWFTCMGGAARCLMRDVLWGSAVGTVAGPPAQGGIQILGGVPLLERSVNVVLLLPCVGLTDGIGSSFGVGLTDGIRLCSLLFQLWECTNHARVLRCSCLCEFSARTCWYYVGILAPRI